jgi:hypothetical protein
MMTLRQFADRLLREEGMSVNNSSWTPPQVAFTGTAPSDIEAERRRRIYEATEVADREMRKWFHINSKKTLVEKITFSLGPDERTIPVFGMRYLELVTDEDGREVVVDGYGSQPRLTMAGYKNIYLPYPVPIAPYRLVITRPGYCKLSPTTETKTLTFYFIRETSLMPEMLCAYDDIIPWLEYVAAGVTHSVDPSDYAQAIGVLSSGVLQTGSLKFVCPTGFPGVGAIVATNVVGTSNRIFRAGTSIEFWVKTNDLYGSEYKFILGTAASCGVIAQETSINIIRSNEWVKAIIPIPVTLTGIISMGIKKDNATANTLWLDTIIKPQAYMDDYQLLAPDEYVTQILDLAVRKQLNQDIGRDTWQTQAAELERRLQGFKSSDGSGERTRRLIVKVP